MSRIFVDGEWYEQLAPGSLYEKEYENIIVQHQAELFPNLILIPNKHIIYSEEDGSIPDFYLIEENYREWWIVEVEMGNHSFDGHVYPQMRTFANATIGDTEIKNIQLANPNLKNNLLRSMVLGIPPQVLVIVNTSKPEWVIPLRRINVQLAELEIFRSKRNKHIFKLDGDIPKIKSIFISECYFDQHLPSILCLASPEKMPKLKDKNITITYKNCVADWEVLISEGGIWLNPAKSNPLEMGYTYELLINKDGKFSFRELL